MTLVKLQWATPDIDAQIAFQARVSNPDNQDNPQIAGLLNYCMREGHVSPFEMANVCMEVNTTRDIARQILRHRSFSFQEFSQRYQDASKLPPVELRECRMQDTENRQNSIELEEDSLLDLLWRHQQEESNRSAQVAYQWALDNGIAKEVARAVLPEGLTESRLFVAGTLRSWLHYVKLRNDVKTQKEHRLIAADVSVILAEQFPDLVEYFTGDSQ